MPESQETPAQKLIGDFAPKIASLPHDLLFGDVWQRPETRLASVERDLARRYSPEQIVGRLRLQFPDDPEMWVSAETIYQSLYVTSRGALRRELTACLRTGRKLRQPGRRPGQRRNRIPDMINIAERPQEADDRAVPGHWEGELVHLPEGYKPEQVAPALARKNHT